MIAGFPSGSEGKEFACSAGDLGSIPGSGRSPGEGNGNPLKNSCLENPLTEEPGKLQSMGLQRVKTQLSNLISLQMTADVFNRRKR